MTLDTLSYKTLSINKENSNKKWVLVDAENMNVGRLASRVALVLRGKHKVVFTPHSDCGDYVIIINAEKVNFSGNKWENKEYIHYTGYPGGQRSVSVKRLMEEKPKEILKKAIKGMLPKNKLARAIIKNLHIYVGNEHNHQAQKPINLDLKTIR